MNYKELNVIIIKNNYSLFLIFKTLNRLNRVKIFTKLNIVNAFNKFRIREDDETLIVFRTRFDFFEYLIIFFNLYNKFVLF